jgi:hypothetical protein
LLLPGIESRIEVAAAAEAADAYRIIVNVNEAGNCTGWQHFRPQGSERCQIRPDFADDDYDDGGDDDENGADIDTEKLGMRWGPTDKKGKSRGHYYFACWVRIMGRCLFSMEAVKQG